VSISTEDFIEDRMALEVLTKAVPQELMGTNANKATAKEAWDSLFLRNIRADHVRAHFTGILTRYSSKPTK
jgi:hypothetical protein